MVRIKFKKFKLLKRRKKSMKLSQSKEISIETKEVMLNKLLWLIRMLSRGV